MEHCDRLMKLHGRFDIMSDKYKDIRNASKDKDLGYQKAENAFKPTISKNTNRILSSACNLTVRDSFDVLSQDSSRRIWKQKELSETRS